MKQPKRIMEIHRPIRLPDRAAGFAGMIRGRLVSKQDNQIVLLVTVVVRQWAHSKAADAKALIGNQVTIVGRRDKRRQSNAIYRFLASLKAGDEVTLDVANRDGETLTVVELTEQQRERIAPPYRGHWDGL